MYDSATDPRDSIDGLGFTIDDLKPERQVVAFYRKLGIAMTPEVRDTIAAALKGAKGISNETQKSLLTLINAPSAD